MGMTGVGVFVKAMISVRGTINGMLRGSGVESVDLVEMV
jgi:hypothetical protein